MRGFFIQSLTTDPLFYLCVVFTVIISIVLHELAHGLAAIKLGDKTPIHTGHMTLDPMVHMGPFSIVILLLVGIAWGQMPIDPTRLRGRFAEAIVAVAGPLTNLALSFFALTVLGVWVANAPDVTGIGPADADHPSPYLQNFLYFLYIFGATNLALCLFNLIPLPPLDGSHILANFNRKYARFVYDPANFNLMQGLFIIVFFVGGRIFGFAHEKAVLYTLHVYTLAGGG
ncbi:MAG: site-2 protease family protein [Planctomycetota bacterium]|jgi:Zn-dependent protease